MEIRIKGKFDPTDRVHYTRKQIDQIPWIGKGFVFIDYLDEDIFLNDVFVLEDGTEIVLREIKLQFDTGEPLAAMGRGWKCLARFENLDWNGVPAVKDGCSDITLVATRKQPSP